MALGLSAHAPGFVRALPSVLLKRMARFYSKAAISLVEEQEEILDLGYEDALKERKRYTQGLQLLGSIKPNLESVKPAERELFVAVLEVVKRFRENIFLVNLRLNHEIGPEDMVTDLLEDYYDGLLVEQRKNEVHIPWDEVKARLDAKHKLS